jgi:hypothetical protein
MTDLTKSTSRPLIPALPEEWIERIFQRMENFYLSLWKDRFGDIPRERVKRAWAEELAGYSVDEIKRGLDTCKTNKFPPTLPEFLTACRPVMDARAEWAEACEQMRVRLEGRGADAWSRPQVYWSAVAIGAYDLNSMAWEQIKTRWTNALDRAKADPIPEYRAALPAPGKQTVTKDEAAGRMVELKQKIESASLPGTTKAGTQWAHRLMAREAAGEQVDHIAVISWREALGYPADMDAKQALEAVKKQQEAA